MALGLQRGRGVAEDQDAGSGDHGAESPKGVGLGRDEPSSSDLFRRPLFRWVCR